MSWDRWQHADQWSHAWWGWGSPNGYSNWEEYRWQQRPRQRSIGVYFGTFDPIHENHVALAKFALEHGFVELVYFVVNGENPLKPLAASYEERFSLVQKRLELEDDLRLRPFHLSKEDRREMRWHDREEIAQRIRKEAEKELGKVQVVFQLLGQDSFEKAVLRAGPKGGKGKGKHGKGKGIFSTRTHFLVFPRAGSSLSVQVPPQMKQRVKVMEDYVDPQPLSSTAIRASAAGSSLETKVHPRLLEEVVQRYTQLRRFFLLFLGPPGSGKSSLGHGLEKAFGFYHLSGGDAYRAAQSRAGSTYRSEDRLQMVAKVPGSSPPHLTGYSRMIYSNIN